MYIAPNSDIRILSHIPINKTYENSLYFPNKEAQTNYFMSQTIRTLTQQYYIRVNEGAIKVEAGIEQLLAANYMMFRNISFGNKWFYAFINKVEYVNNVTSIIYFEIDVLQTYLFDIVLHQCFVEREHSATDGVGDNLLSEPVKPDIYNEQTILRHEWDTYYPVLFKINRFESGNNVRVEPVNARYKSTASGIAYTMPTLSTLTATLGVDIGELAGDYDTVICMIMYPAELISGEIENGRIESIGPASINMNASLYRDSARTQFITIDGYEPKNKKLYTYPYNFLAVDNGNNEIVLKWEEFAARTDANFELYGLATPTPQAVLYPINYLGSGVNIANPLFAISIDSFPQNALPVDSYKAWCAQKSSGEMLNAVTSIGSGVVQGAASGAMTAGKMGLSSPQGLAVGAIGGGLMSGLNSFGSYMTSERFAKDASDSYRGNCSTVLDSIHGTMGFRVKQKCCRYESAKAIDDFFTLYGYSCGKVKQPNIAVRPHFTYTKTSGCIITGSCPQDDITKICSIFDSGIRFWMNPQEVGNYNVDNSPTGV